MSSSTSPNSSPDLAGLTLDSFPLGISVIDGQGRILQTNAAANRLLGLTSSEHEFRTLRSPEWKVFRSDGSPVAVEDLPGYRAFHEQIRIEEPEMGVLRPDGEMVWLNITAAPLGPDRVVITYGDITDVHRSKAILAARSRLSERAQELSLEHLLRATLDETEALTGSCIGFYHFMDSDQEAIQLKGWSTRTEAEFCRAEGKDSHYAISMAGVWADCVRERRPLIHNDYANLPNRKGMPPGHATVLRELVVPVFRAGLVVAILGVGNKPTDYNEEDVETVQTFADLAWDLVEQKRTDEALRNSEARWHSLVEQAGDGFELLDQEGRYLQVNEASCQSLGYSRAELLGMTVFEVDPGLTPELFLSRVMALLDQPAVTFETVHKRKDGTEFPAELTASVIRLGGDIRVLAQGRDISERKRIEGALRQSEAKQGAMIANISDVIAIISPDGINRFKSPNVEKWFGWKPEELVGQSAWDKVHPDDLAMVQGIFTGLLNGTDASATGQCRYHCKDGGYRWIGFTATNLLHTPEIEGVLLNYHDITERRAAKESLLEAEWKFRALFEEGPIGVAYHRMVYDLSGKPVDYFFIDANEKYIDLTGVNPTGKMVTAAFPGIEKDPFDWIGTFGKVAQTGESIRFEQYLEANDRWYDCVGYQYAPDHFVAAFLEITDRKRTETELQRMTDRLKLATRAGGVGIWEWDLATNQLLWDHQMYALYGTSEEHFGGAYEAWKAGLHPDDAERGDAEAQMAIRGEKDFDTELRVIWPDGSVHNIRALGHVQRDASGKPLRMIGTNWDITLSKKAEEHKRQIEAQLQQSQKMESLGTLAGGVAHDMNNVLGAILGLASAHISTQPYGSPLHKALDTICKSTERGGKMVKSLLSFARQSPVESQKLDINAILQEQVSLLERTTLATVRLQLDLEMELRPIQGDASTLTHAFMNLCVNAVDAMPENGTLTLHTRNVDNGWIEVEVEDNGMGMPKEVLEKAMEPFFTTKEIGKGTGLGLSMVFSTVKAHRGQMAIESEPGVGTRVRLRFPASEPENTVRVAEPKLPGGTQVPHGSHKVLLVDDDDLIQGSILTILEVLGHTEVTAALSGEEALAILEAGFEPDFVILDMNMPGMGGAGALPRLRELRPAVPVLLSTGRIDQTALNLASAHSGVTLLSKPFGLRELQKHLENLGLG